MGANKVNFRCKKHHSLDDEHITLERTWSDLALLPGFRNSTKHFIELEQQTVLLNNSKIHNIRWSSCSAALKLRIFRSFNNVSQPIWNNQKGGRVFPIKKCIEKDFFTWKKVHSLFYSEKSGRTKFCKKKISPYSLAHLIFWQKNVAFLQGKKVGQTKKTASWPNC